MAWRKLRAVLPATESPRALSPLARPKARFSPLARPKARFDPPGPSDPARLARAVPWLAGALPLAYYVAAASAHGGLLEEGSFVAAARNLAVAHPPGAPIEALLAAGLALVPIGPLPFRVAIVSALCTALTLALFARALMSTLRHLGEAEPRFAALLALGASLWLGQTPLFFAQAVRPQVFAVQFALSLLIIYTLLRFEEEEPHGSTRVLYFGAFLQGLCFANHHVYGLLMLPVAAPTLGRVFARRGFIGLMGYLTAPIVGFSVYLYVPLRLAHMPETGLAHASGFARTLTMLSEEPYAGPSWAAPVTLSAVVRDGLALRHPALLGLLALSLVAGLWVCLRSSQRRRFGTLWFIALVVPWLSVRWVLPARASEDVWGALLPCACALTAIASAGAAFLLTQLVRMPARVHEAVALLSIALGLFGLVTHDAREARAESRVADEADELTRRQLPANAVLFTDQASSGFWYQGREAEEALRADVTLVPLSLRTRPHVVEAWAERTPELADTLRALMISGALDPGALQSLNALRPVFVEPSDDLPHSLLATTVPDGLFLRVRSEGVTKRDRDEATVQRTLRMQKLVRLNALLPPATSTHASVMRAVNSAESAP